MHLIYHTIAWQYFPAEKQAEGTALIEAAGAGATASRPLAWLGLEADGGTEGAAITLRLWPGICELRWAAPIFTAAGCAGRGEARSGPHCQLQFRTTNSIRRLRALFAALSFGRSGRLSP
ncbi:DUF2332 family protein [Seohaeicola zhoushanensis]